MGYYTYYNLDVNNVRSQAEHEALYEALNKKGIIGYAFYGGDWDKKNTSSFWNDDCVKWYDYDEDMRKIAKAFPEMTFKLTGVGEDYDDRWYCLYKNGEMERIDAIITWPEPQRIKWED